MVLAVLVGFRVGLGRGDHTVGGGAFNTAPRDRIDQATAKVSGNVHLHAASQCETQAPVALAVPAAVALVANVEGKWFSLFG